jgi:hypothetical protein
MIACGKKEEVEVISPYKIVVVRTCILNFLHSDPPVEPTMLSPKTAPTFCPICPAL